jgi:mono/diheme cytochrome c family protein
MSRPYKEDLIDREKPDLMEANSQTFLIVPKLLFVAMAIFGVSYLTLQTKDAHLGEGDKRGARAVVVPVSAADPQLGATLYKKNCQACHQPTGLGIPKAFPPLAGSEWVNGDPQTLCAIVLHGISGPIEVNGATFKGVMPAFKGKLSPTEVAAVTTYLRASWNNQSAAIDAETVEQVARKTSDRSGPWKGGAELKEQIWDN